MAKGKARLLFACMSIFYRRICISVISVKTCTKVHVYLDLSNRVIVTRLVSAAGTGFYYTVRKPRVKERMILRKYDPVGGFINLD